MYELASRHAPNAAFLLPALFAASASEMATHFAKQFTSLAIGLEGGDPAITAMGDATSGRPQA